MKSEYEITLIRREESAETTSKWGEITIEKCTGSDLVEVCAQFPLLIARIQKKIEESIRREHGLGPDDDIPF